MELTIQKRSLLWKKVKALTKKSIVPAVIYGRHLDKNVNIQVDKNHFLKVFRQVWRSTPLTLKGDGINHMVLIHDLKLHPVYDTIAHIDFLAIKADQKVRADVSIVLSGKAPVEKNNLWKIQLLKSSLEVEALPKHLPHDIAIDVSTIEAVDHVIFVKDIDLGKEVKIIEDADLPVLTVVEFNDDDSEDEQKASTEEKTAA